MQHWRSAAAGCCKQKYNLSCTDKTAGVASTSTPLPITTTTNKHSLSTTRPKTNVVVVTAASSLRHTHAAACSCMACCKAGNNEKGVSVNHRSKHTCLSCMHSGTASVGTKVINSDAHSQPAPPGTKNSDSTHMLYTAQHTITLRIRPILDQTSHKRTHTNASC